MILAFIVGCIFAAGLLLLSLCRAAHDGDEVMARHEAETHHSSQITRH